MAATPNAWPAASTVFVLLALGVLFGVFVGTFLGPSLQGAGGDARVAIGAKVAEPTFDGQRFSRAAAPRSVWPRRQNAAAAGVTSTGGAAPPAGDVGRAAGGSTASPLRSVSRRAQAPRPLGCQALLHSRALVASTKVAVATCSLCRHALQCQLAVDVDRCMSI